MLKRLIQYIFIFSLIFSALDSSAQATAKAKKAPTAVLKVDTSKIEAAKFDRNELRSYADEKEFQYHETGQKLSAWDLFWAWIWRIIGTLLGAASSNPISRYFFVLLGVAIAIFIAIKIIGSNVLFGKKSKEVSLPYHVMDENIHEIDYDKELQSLLSQGEYRLAIRLLYLRTLKQLSDADIIHWQIDKTNYHYLSEINQPELKEAFASLTLKFDYVWYGNFAVDKESFEPINQSFNQFNTKIR
ncbi:DUF4129 domain-containing protein [Pedobacter sp. MW01-1-1]|uniref:DUF4129 domain-containing protein n=1 Tax=Pedobacter sp. MW01-1-1 TaxID=3383027 RepID=UPI003FF13E09